MWIKAGYIKNNNLLYCYSLAMHFDKNNRCPVKIYIFSCKKRYTDVEKQTYNQHYFLKMQHG
jgi:hypothetical protein